MKGFKNHVIKASYSKKTHAHNYYITGVCANKIVSVMLLQ